MLLLMLAVFLGVLTYTSFTIVMKTYQEKKEISKKTNLNIFKTFNDKDELKGFIGMIVITTLLFVGFYFSLTNSALFEDSTPSKWDSLTKEEKQWYKDNYGGGKGKEIQDAIDKYKNK